MNRIGRIGLAGLLLVWAVRESVSPPNPVAADEKKAEVAQPTIAALVEDLGHPVYSIRERASRELWKRGAAAREAVAVAAKSSDAEVARRAKDLLEKFDWGIFPDTPPEVTKQLQEFRSGDFNRQKPAVLALLKHGKPGRSVLRAALAKTIPTDIAQEMGKREDDFGQSRWRKLSEFIATTVRQESLKHLNENRLDDVDDLLSLNVMGTSSSGLADYAVFQYLRGTTNAAVEQVEATRKAGGPPAQTARMALVYLYRAQREWAKARTLADGLPQAPNEPRVLEMLLEEEGDWATLGKREAAFGRANLPDGLKLTLLRLAGKKQDAQTAVEELVKNADAFTTREDIQQIAFSLLLNQRAIEATSLLLDKRMNLGLLAELLIAQMRFKDALDLVGGKTAELSSDPREMVEFDLRRARLLLMIGKRSEAIQLFGKVAESLRLNPEGGRILGDTGLAIRSLLRAEMRLGLRDTAAEHAAAFLASDDRRFRDMFRYGESPFEILFDSDARPAEALFWVLRNARKPSDSAGDSLRRVRELFIGKAPASAVDEAVKLLRDATTGDPPEAEETGAARRKVERLLAEATVLKAAKRYADAENAYLDAAKAAAPGGDEDDDEDNRPRGARSWVYGTSDDFRPWLELGDFYTDRGRHADAARQFAAGAKRFPDQPILLFLHGQALKKAGQVAEGQKTIERSHWVSLGNERVRGRYLEELVRRGAANAARRETDLLLHACWSRDGYFGNVMNQAARAAVLNQDFATAEACVQRSLMVILKVQGVHFVEAASYLTVPQNMAALHARALLAEGKVNEAMAQAKAYLAVQPGSSGLVIDMVPDLDAAGKKKEADELFRLGWEAFAKMLEEHPDSASARNSAAWLAANCQRELDTALKYAEDAVKADPASVSYRESLAEVHFRRGQREKALALMEQLTEEAPRSRLFRRQLERYRHGAITSPIRETEPE